MKTEKKFKVYCLRDVKGDIKYIGVTTRSLTRRLGEHRRKVYIPSKLIRIELIASYDNPTNMFALESMLIEQYNLVNIGWNRSKGIIKLPNDLNGKKLEDYLLSEPVYLDIKGKAERNAFWGCTHSDEIKKMIGDRSKGNSYALGNSGRSGLINKKSHNRRIGLANSKSVICLDTNEIFESQATAAKELKLHQSKISSVCLGIRKTTGGLRFAFINDNRPVSQKCDSKETSLIAGNSLSSSDHNVIGNDKRDGSKTTRNWTISSQDPEMDKVQRSADIGVGSEWNRNGKHLTE